MFFWIFIICGAGALLGLIAYKIERWLYNKKWTYIETLNIRSGITRENAYIDRRGYLRWVKNDKLCHRDIAFKHRHEYRAAGVRFGECDVHHRDENKFNNNPENLDVLTREQHQLEHGSVVYRNGVKYIKFARTSKIYRTTAKAILVAHKWIPVSQILISGGWIYLTQWMYDKKFNN
ncbi:MAG: HNH endonuclease [Promethearchaeota archaeon]